MIREISSAKRLIHRRWFILSQFYKHICSMRIKYFISIVMLLIFLFSSDDADAQRRRKSKYGKRKVRNKSISRYKGGSVGGKFRPYSYLSYNINALNYYGDLAPVNKAASTDVSWTRPGAGVNIGYKFNPHTAFRAGFNYGRIKGDDISSDPTSLSDRPRYLRNLSFRNDIKEFHMGFELYLFPNYGGPNVRKPFNVYLFAGGAVFHHEPKGKVPNLDYTTGGIDPAPKSGEWVRLRKLGTEGQYISGVGVDKPYFPFQFAIPLGLGVKMRLAGPFSLGMEVTYRYLFTDYIDDVSTSYVRFDYFDDPLVRIMSDRSAEPFGVLTNIQRQGITIAEQTINGIKYYATGDLGGGIALSDENPAQRGNPNDGDTYFMTSVNLTWIISKAVKRTAKFR